MDSLVCLVTGCSYPTGFGARTSVLLAGHGHRVFAGVLDRDHDPAVEILETASVRPVPLDVTDDGQVAGALDAILDAEGRLDVLVNNAAFAAIGALEDTRLATFRRIVEVNLLGPHRLVRRVLPSMRAQGQGVIVNVGSVNGFVPEPMIGAYSASKAGLSAYTEVLAYEVAHFGIRVHLVEPGGFTTGIHERAPWEPGGLDPGNPYYPAQVGWWGDPRAWEPSALGDPEVVARAIVSAIEDRTTPLFVAVAEDTAELRRSVFGIDEAARRARVFAQLPRDISW